MVVGDTITASAPVLDCAAMLRHTTVAIYDLRSHLERSLADQTPSGVGSVDYAV